MDSLALRLTPSWRQGFDGVITHTAAQATTCVIGISHDELLSVHERHTSFLTHRMARMKGANPTVPHSRSHSLNSRPKQPWAIHEASFVPDDVGMMGTASQKLR